MWITKNYRTGEEMTLYSENEYKELETKYNNTVKQYNSLLEQYNKLLKKEI